MSVSYLHYRSASAQLPTAVALAPGVTRLRVQVCIGVALACLAVGTAGKVRAQASAPTIDNHRGPLLTSARVTGMAGAYTSVAEGIEGYFRNPASVANRRHDQTDWFQPSLTLDWLFTPLGNVDYDNDGNVFGNESSVNSWLFGMKAALGNVALGGIFATRSHTVSVTGLPELTSNDYEFGVTLGVALGEGSLVLGGGTGLRTVSFLTEKPDRPVTVTGGMVNLARGIDYTAPYFDLGMLYRPTSHNWRLGGRFRLPASATPGQGSAGTFAAAYGGSQAAPAKVNFPWEAGVGLSYAITAGGRPRNAAMGNWGSELRVRDNRYLLFSFDMILDGPSPNSINLESYLAGDGPKAGYRTSGEAMSFGFHAGAEAEVWHDRLRVRGGAYTEPDRASGALIGRHHLTWGADFRIIDLWLFRIKVGAAADIAPRYHNVQLGFGLW